MEAKKAVGTAEESGDVRFSKRVDSEGRELSEAQQEFFKDSKVRDEEGRLLTVYHGSDKEFFVFDRTKARANMDIQGSFFSPWEIDAQGYGGKVGEYYLNIVNPASEAMGYKALKKFQGQNGAGIKAREYLQSLGYDGVNNGGEECIAFESNQIKSVTNQTPTENPDIRYSMRRKLDSFDSKEYNEVKLGKQEYARLSTAIGTYQPNARGFVTQILDNEKGEPAYCYDVIVSDNRIVVLRKYGGTNIHEKRRYAASYRERKDTYRGTGGRGYAGQSNNSDDLGLGGRATAGNNGVYQRRIEDKTKSYGRKFGENTSDSGERSRENLTVSDLGKIQYQLRIEDKNRLDILDKQETRLTADLKTLEKAYAEAIRAEYERSIKPSEETSRRAAEISRKAAKRKPTKQKREPPAVVLFFIYSARECSLLYHPVPAAAVQAALQGSPPAHRQGKRQFRSSSYTPSMP